MRKDQWDDYGRYLVIADKCRHKVKGNYAAFIEFRRVLLALKKMAVTHNSQWFEFEGNRFKKLIDNPAVEVVLRDFADAEYNTQYLAIAKQIGAKIS